MKIAMLGHKRIPSRAGGVEVVVEELAKRMVKQGHEVWVYNRNCGENKHAEYDGIRIVEIPTFKRSSLNAVVYSALATLHVIFHRFDVVHYHAEGPCSMLPIARLFGKKTVATVHGLDWQRSKWGGFASKYIKFGEKMAAKHAHKLIVLSDSVRRYFKEIYGREAQVIPNGINRAEKRAPDVIKKYGLSGRDYILFLARITPEKGLDYLIDAFKQIKTDKKLVIAGELKPSDEYTEHIRKKAESDGRIIFTDFVQGEELDELFSNCYVYVLPSDVEGMPISLLEAVSFGARVLVSDICENTECLKGYGHTFKKGDVQSLAETLCELIESEELYDSDFKEGMTPQEVNTQIEALLNAYDWNDVTDKTIEIYKELIK